MQAQIVVLAGDGIGPEITAVTVQALKEIASQYGHIFSFQEQDFQWQEERKLLIFPYLLYSNT